MLYTEFAALVKAAGGDDESVTVESYDLVTKLADKSSALGIEPLVPLYVKHGHSGISDVLLLYGKLTGFKRNIVNHIVMGLPMPIKPAVYDYFVGILGWPAERLGLCHEIPEQRGWSASTPLSILGMSQVCLSCKSEVMLSSSFRYCPYCGSLNGSPLPTNNVVNEDPGSEEDIS